jgi:hypothetical protein
MKRLALVLLIVLLLPAKLSAQRDLFLVDDTQSLDPDAIIAAADPLLLREASVAVYLKTGGGEGDLLNNLQTDGLIDESGQLRESAIIVYISIDPAFTQIRYGERWRSALEDYEASLLPVFLDQGDYEVAITSTLSSLEAAIVAEESRNQEWYLYVVIAATGLALIFGFVRLFYMALRGIFRFGRQLSQ